MIVPDVFLNGLLSPELQLQLIFADLVNQMERKYSQP
jgi:hypothetical protein